MLLAYWFKLYKSRFFISFVIFVVLIFFSGIEGGDGFGVVQLYPGFHRMCTRPGPCSEFSRNFCSGLASEVARLEFQRVPGSGFEQNRLPGRARCPVSDCRRWCASLKRRRGFESQRRNCPVLSESSRFWMTSCRRKVRVTLFRHPVTFREFLCFCQLFRACSFLDPPGIVGEHCALSGCESGIRTSSSKVQFIPSKWKMFCRPFFKPSYSYDQNIGCPKFGNPDCLIFK